MSAAKEGVVMANTETTTEVVAQVTELKTANEKLQAELAEVVAAKDSEIAQIKEQAAQLLAQEIEKLQTEMLAEAAKKMDEEKKAKDEEMTKVKSELDAANEVIAGYKMKEEEMTKKEKKMKRMASLVEVGFDNEAASATVDKFESLDDVSFEAMTSLFAGKLPPWLNKKDKEDDKEKKDKPKASSDNADPQVLEQAEEDESVNLSVGGETESQVDSTRAALVEFVCSKLGKKNNK
jgi:predicted membrane-bound mannosyltransferase